MRIPRLLVAVVAIVAVRPPVVAQEASRDTVRAAPIVVTATRAPLSQSVLPVAVSVIRGEELRARGVTTVADALNDVTSAYVAQSGSAGATTSLFLRGGESKYVKVLIDGVAANDPGGTYDFASLTMDNVDRIEIVRGPASVIYGADAVTGVINVITRRGSGNQRVELDVRGGAATREHGSGSTAPCPAPGCSQPGSAGTMQSIDVTGSLSGALAAGTYSFAVARHQSTGLYRLNNHFQNNVASGRFVLRPAAETELRLAMRYNDYRFNYPTNGGGTAVDSNAYRTEDRTVLGVEVERAFSTAWRSTLALSSSMNDGGTNDEKDTPTGNRFISQDRVRRRSAELRAQWTPASSAAITVGAQAEQQDQRSQSQGQFGTFTSNSIFAAARRNTGVYGELIATPFTRLTATAGGRLDHNEQFGDFTTARVGLSWRVLASTRIRATAGTAFREPTFFENYSTSAFARGNPDLAPERTRSADAGIEQDLLNGRAQVGVTGFAQRFENLIDYDGAAGCGFNYCNVARAESNGIEGELRALVAGPWSATVGTTFLKTRVIDPGFDQTSGGLYRKGETLIRRPQNKSSAELAYRGRSRLSGAMRVLAVGKRADRDFRSFPATPVTLPAYERVDFGADYALRESGSSRSSLALRVENLTNASYQNVFNFLAPRRTVSIGIRSMF